MTMLNIYEYDHTALPGTKTNYFEVHLGSGYSPIFSTESLDRAVEFCYASGHNFTVHTVKSFNNGE